MSFILDAIRKSETERQKNKQPDTQSFQSEGSYRGEARSAFWRAFSLLLAMALLIFIAWWLWPKLSEQFGLEVNFSLSNPETGSSSTGEVANASNANLQETDQSSELANQRNISTSPGELPPRHQIKELWELPADYQSLVPDMTFTWHTFGTESSLRSVEVNGRMLKEGDRVAAGLKLHVITSTGVIMHYRDRYFFVDVQEKLSQ